VPASPWRNGRDLVDVFNRAKAESHVRARHRQVRVGVAGFRDCSGPAPEWTAEYRLPLCVSASQRIEAQCSSSSPFPAATPAASNSRLASRASTVLRSKGLTPCP
jgi:hypothetical protein